MKIAQGQLHMYTNIMFKFQSSMCKTVGEKLLTKLCPWTDKRTAMAIPVYPPPLCCGGGKITVQRETILTPIVGKGETGNQHIVLFQQSFLLFPFEISTFEKHVFCRDGNG